MMDARLYLLRMQVLNAKETLRRVEASGKELSKLTKEINESAKKFGVNLEEGR